MKRDSAKTWRDRSDNGTPEERRRHMLRLHEWQMALLAEDMDRYDEGDLGHPRRRVLRAAFQAVQCDHMDAVMGGTPGWPTIERRGNGTQRG